MRRPKLFITLAWRPLRAKILGICSHWSVVEKASTCCYLIVSVGALTASMFRTGSLEPIRRGETGRLATARRPVFHLRLRYAASKMRRNASCADRAAGSVSNCRSICRSACMMVVWSRPPSFRPISA